jgi:glycosyltransferase involved in cell wall biosynthesis
MSGDDLAQDARFEHLWQLVMSGHGALALRQLDIMANDLGLTAGFALHLKTQLLDALRQWPQKVNRPADYWMLGSTGATGPATLRRMHKHVQKLPRPFPFGLRLPNTAPLTTTNLTLPAQMEKSLPAGMPAGLGRVAVILSSDNPKADLAALRDMLAQQSLQLPDTIAVFSNHHQGDAPHLVPHSLNTPEAQSHLQRIADTSDQLLFLEGGTQIDATAIERLCRLAACSDTIVQPLTAPKEDEAFTPFALGKIKAASPFSLPFRGMQGCNFMVSSALFRKVGGISAVFHSRVTAPYELAYRMFLAGAWFQPQQVPKIVRGTISPADAPIYRSLCPNPVDRPRGAGFDVPNVQIYIPAFNSARFLPDAIDSVLAQNYPDLEVCIHDDGSTDDTLAMLAQRYGGNPRVRWQSGPNKGIGHASNAAIAMGRGMYIGQLDADDRLLPGAISKLVAVLRADPGIACAYGSCERIDASGAVLQLEYDWPEFTREKLAVTSIVHHFRMFRRAAFGQTDGFRCDIRNAVDYDIFLKLSETGRFVHVPKVMYQRRWHGGNTSLRHEAEQSKNTHIVQRSALLRIGLAQHWDIDVPDPEKPRLVSYARKKSRPMLMFWPDYSGENPYQRLLYTPLVQKGGAEVCAATPEAALRAVQSGTVDPKTLTFHLHWLHFIFKGVTDEDGARAAANHLALVLRTLKAAGVRLVWTVHNLTSHEAMFPSVELGLSRYLTKIADLVHLHDAAALADVQRHFPIEPAKQHIARHGHYLGVYPDYVPPKMAREYLGIDAQDEVILFCGAVRPYKGVPELITAFRALRRPKARLVIAGAFSFDPFAELPQPLTDEERARITVKDAYVDESELQLYFKSADVVALPYRRILTSGSVIMAFGFGCPVVLPSGTALEKSLNGLPFVTAYGGGNPAHPSLEAALDSVLNTPPTARASLAQAARAYAADQEWPNSSGHWLNKG